MLADKQHASPSAGETEAAGRLNKRIAVICWIAMIGPGAFIYFALFQDGFQSPYFMVALAALFVWLGGNAFMMVRSIFSYRKQIDALSSVGRPVGRASRAR
jgi:hypothetical protein